MIEYVFFISNLMSQSHIAPLFIFCLVLNDYHNALSVFGLIICYCFMLRFYCVVFMLLWCFYLFKRHAFKGI
ncbi:putative membrane protein [Escherichia coli DEC8A]|nr:putative membrane protein [Escherichia coli DEC8A]